MYSCCVRLCSTSRYAWAHLVVHAVLELHNQVLKRSGSRLLNLLQTRPALPAFTILPLLAGNRSVGRGARQRAAPAQCVTILLRQDTCLKLH